MQTRRRLPHDSLKEKGTFVNFEEERLIIPTTIDSDNRESIEKSNSIKSETEDKYSKSRQVWNLRSLSNRLQFNSGNVLRTYIQQPLSEVTAAVTGSSLDKDISFQEPPSQLYTDGLELNKNFEVMAFRDRTLEFTNAIRSVQARNVSLAANIKNPRKVKNVQSYSEFMLVAKYIGRSIASTYAKLEKLALLANRKSLFDDRPKEIQELTYIIKGDLNALNQQIARLQEISRSQRQNKGCKHLLSHSCNMVIALQSKLANMSSNFKQILEVRTENLKQQNSRRDQFIEGPIAVTPVTQLPRKGAFLLLNEEKNEQVSIDMSTNDMTTQNSGVQVQQQMAIYDESENYAQQRAETMQNIESTIIELGGIFQQLAHMVKEQEEIVDRIDTNVQDSELNIEAAHGEILKYFHSVSKNRWLMIKIFGVLIFFFIFFIVFMT